MKKIRVGINGFGRIGRQVFRALHQSREQTNARPAAPAGRKLHKIMDSRARWGGDKGHALRIIRQGPFALVAEIAQSRQLTLAGLKGLRKQALARLDGTQGDLARLLNVAHRFQSVTDWHLRRAPGAAAAGSAG